MSENEKNIEDEIREMESEVENISIDDEEIIDDENEKEEINEFEQKYLRLLADYENLKRNNAKDIVGAKNNGKIEVFRELLDVLDNFERSMEYEIGTEDYAKGISMVHTQLISKLESLGLEKISDLGQMDANIHQAVMVEENADLEDDEIIEILQNGYKLEDRLIRPAMVKVNKK